MTQFFAGCLLPWVAGALQAVAGIMIWQLSWYILHVYMDTERQRSMIECMSSQEIRSPPPTFEFRWSFVSIPYQHNASTRLRLRWYCNKWMRSWVKQIWIWSQIPTPVQRISNQHLQHTHYYSLLSRAGPIQYIWRVATHDSNWPIATQSIALIWFNFWIKSLINSIQFCEYHAT